MKQSRRVIWENLQEKLMGDAEFRKKIINKLYKRTKLAGDNECWEWTGEKSDSGYGVFRLMYNVSSFRAHRLMFVATNITSIPDGMCVCHTCDNRGCVNPRHFFIGTKKDNSQDAVRKGRMKIGPPMRGESNPSSKLTNQQVFYIRKTFTPRRKQGAGACGTLAKQFGVTNQTIWRIVTRREWKTVN